MFCRIQLSTLMVVAMVQARHVRQSEPEEKTEGEHLGITETATMTTEIPETFEMPTIIPGAHGGRSSGTGFCYNDAEGCGPGTDKWPEICRNGQSQSPIDFNMNPRAGPNYFIRLTGYKVPHFKMTNNGHSVVMSFEGITTDARAPHLSKSATAADVEEDNYKNRYQFAQAHFHWGKGDAGSEHSVGGHFAALELHLVHFSKMYKNISEALGSNDPKAMVVLGILFEVREAIKTHVALRPVIDNLSRIQIPDHIGKFEKIEEHLDFSTLFEEPSTFYNYQGSLTTPGCQEIVNWFVLKKWLKITTKDLDAFRVHIKDEKGRKLLANHRQVQPLNDREVTQSDITFVYPGTS